MNRLIGTSALPYLDPPPAARRWPSRAAALAERAIATEVLEHEYGSTRRLLMGTAAAFLLIVAVCAAGVTVALWLTADLSVAEGGLVGVVGLVITVVAAVPGWRLARAATTAGRRVVDALVAWHRLPESVDHDGTFIPPEHRQRNDALGSADRRRISTHGAIAARTYVFRGPLFVRIAISGLLIVVVLLTWGMAISGAALADEAADIALAITLAGLAAVLTAALVVLLSGAYRVNAAHACRDPVSRAIVAWFKGALGRS